MTMPHFPRNMRHLGIAFVILGVVIVLPRGGSTLAAPRPEAKTVRLIIDFGDGVEIHFKALAWREEMSVLDVLSAAKAHPRGVSFSQRGSGRSAMITAIGGEQNQGGGADSKNWLYYVDDELAVVGAGARTVEPGDVVLWKYQTYDYNP